jgi:hypothetical protein
MTDVFLMRFWGKYCLEKPSTVANLTYVADLFESCHSTSHDRELVRTIHYLFNSDWVCVACINDAFVIAHRDKNSAVVEHRPVFSNKSVNGLLQWRVEV